MLPGPGERLRITHIMDARRRIAPHVLFTPLVRSHYLSRLTGGDIHLKLECQQLLRSFKVRGMASRVLSLTPGEKVRGVIVSSSGNHGAAASYCGHRWGVPVEVYVPGSTPDVKLELIRRWGARVHLVGTSFDEADQALEQRLEGERGPVLVDAASDPVAVAGHGTIGIEILEGEPFINDIVVPVGGGGLVTGIGVAARALGPGVRVVGVQTEACPALAASLADGVLHRRYPCSGSACDALVGGAGKLAFDHAQEFIDRCDTVSEDAIRDAVRVLLEEEKVVAEPSGAVGVAWIMTRAGSLQGRKVAAVVSGGNVDPLYLKREVFGSRPSGRGPGWR